MGVENTPQYRQQGEPNQSPREGGRDYAAMLTSIRADQGRVAFVADLLRNKDQLLALTDEIVKEQWTLEGEPERKHRIAKYVNTVLKVHVFDMDPFPYQGHNFEYDQALQEHGASGLTRSVAKAHLKHHPDSEAARAISLFGLHATSKEHQTLLHEVWRSYLPAITGHLEKKQ